MAGPAKIKSPSDTLANGVEGIQQLTVSEVKNYTANIITTAFAATKDTASLDITTGSVPAGYTEVGTFNDTFYTVPVGTHPLNTGGFSTTTYRLSQKTSASTDNKTAVPLRITDVGTLEESSDTEIDTEILDQVIKAMVDGDGDTAGRYWLSASAPTGGTWVSRGTLTDTQTDNTTVTKTLWQKTTATTVPSSTTNRTLVKYDTDGITELSTSELQSLTNRMRNRIIDSSIGTYVLDSSAPGTGTWQQLGETMTDQRKTYSYVNYSGSYSGPYAGTYTGSYSGAYAGTYTDTFILYYGGFVGGYYTGSFEGYYSGSYSGTYSGSYSGTYIGSYGSATLNATSGTISSRRLYIRIA